LGKERLYRRPEINVYRKEIIYWGVLSGND